MGEAKLKPALTEPLWSPKTSNDIQACHLAPHQHTHDMPTCQVVRGARSGRVEYTGRMTSKPVKHFSDGPRSLGAELAIVRKEMGLTQKQLAVQSGISRNSVGSIERGEWKPRPDTLRAIAEGASMGKAGTRDDFVAGLLYERLMRAAGYTTDGIQFLAAPEDDESRQDQLRHEMHIANIMEKARDILRKTVTAGAQASYEMMQLAMEIVKIDPSKVDQNTLALLDDLLRWTGDLRRMHQPLNAEYRIIRDRRLIHIMHRIAPLASEEQVNAILDDEDRHMSQLKHEVREMEVISDMSKKMYSAATGMVARLQELLEIDDEQMQAYLSGNTD